MLERTQLGLPVAARPHRIFMFLLFLGSPRPDRNVYVRRGKLAAAALASIGSARIAARGRLAAPFRTVLRAYMSVTPARLVDETPMVFTATHAANHARVNHSDRARMTSW